MIETQSKKWFKNWQLYRQILKGEKRSVFVLLFTLIFGGIALQIVIPQFIRNYIDYVESGSSVSTLIGVAVAILCFTFIHQGMKLLLTIVSENVGWRATNRLRMELIEHCLRLDLSFFKDRSSGEMIERVDGDVTALARFFSRFILLVIGNGLLLIGILIVLFIEDWRLGIGFTLFSLISFVSLNFLRKISIPFWIQARQKSADFYGFLLERLSGMEEIRTQGSISYTVKRFLDSHQEAMFAERKAYVFTRYFWPAISGLFSIGFAILFFVGSDLYQQGWMTVGTLFMIYTYLELLKTPIWAIVEEIQDFQKAGAGLERIQSLFAIKSEMIDGDQEVAISGGASIQFRNVTFAYDEGKEVLHHLSFRLLPGQSLALLGRTGSGKTTITRLLLRLYDVTTGSIQVAGIDVRNWNVDALRNEIGIVTQEVRLFQESVRENIRLFNESISDEQIWEVIDELGLRPWAEQLPQGLDTLVGDGGTGLSAGEGQLISLARIFVRNPSIIILDEPSSRLDPLTEQWVKQAISHLIKGRTAIFIAHRLETVKEVDQILILEDGKIVEYGEQTHLIQDPNSRFSKLLRTGEKEVFS
ncbi:ABC transporter ATP-binding protein [Hazenella coriacea]|uniref:ATP-binding cassette subfamily B protein/ATP-binding cassette subfamily C protein n=1 Tax=Hazenella coriacea TaxID=1179467 RepID=A0A4R3LBW9_9BACL|nr:ABC transporter ATP-binding protein [Hazenella coriacea]TCS96798.1 ATP-binding cassette subfamily B protein/ATP-binding cassette subfamily C protein [Hazenella coriacea]